MKHYYCTDHSFFEIDRDTNQIIRRTSFTSRLKIDKFIDELYEYAYLKEITGLTFDQAKELASEIETRFLKLYRSKFKNNDYGFSESDYKKVLQDLLPQVSIGSFANFRARFIKREEEIQKKIKALPKPIVITDNRNKTLPSISSELFRETQGSNAKKLTAIQLALETAYVNLSTEGKIINGASLSREAKCSEKAARNFLKKKDFKTQKNTDLRHIPLEQRNAERLRRLEEAFIKIESLNEKITVKRLVQYARCSKEIASAFLKEKLMNQ